MPVFRPSSRSRLFVRTLPVALALSLLVATTHGQVEPGSASSEGPGDVPAAASGEPATSKPPVSPLRDEVARANYLINFIRFTEWPDDSSDTPGPLVIGVSGDRPLEAYLLDLESSLTIRGRSLLVVRLRNPRNLEACHVAYFNAVADPGDEPALDANDALPLLRGRPTLTISESPDFWRQGGIINLYREGENLRFEIAADAARASGLNLSSRLLALARIYPVPPESPRRKGSKAP